MTADLALTPRNGLAPRAEAPPPAAGRGDARGSAFPRLFARLAARFKQDEEKVLVKGSATIRYVTARTVANRLDEVLGNENWWDEYFPLMADSVLCRLTCRLPDGSVVTKADAGGAANMKDAGDDDKSMVSDAFKRAAAKFGVGRYLYGDGVSPYVLRELEARKAERGVAETPAAAPAPAPPPELDSRSAVNGAFRGGSRDDDGDADEPARDPRSKEPTPLWGDRVGARGLDVRKWADVQDGAVLAVRTRLDRHRVDELGLMPLEEKAAPNAFQYLNHMVRASVEAGAEDPNGNPVDPATGKRKAIGNGKKADHLHRLYLDGRWREWMREEARDYLTRKLREGVELARTEAGMVDPPGPGAEAAVGSPEGEPEAGAVGGEWQAGRE